MGDDSELNLAKTDGDAAEWLPPHQPAMCDYVSAYIAVKAERQLTVDSTEHDALADALDDCTRSNYRCRALTREPRTTRNTPAVDAQRTSVTTVLRRMVRSQARARPLRTRCAEGPREHGPCGVEPATTIIRTG